MRISWTRCPHCRRVLEFKTEGAGGTKQDFGEPQTFRCSFCQNLVWNGLEEWADLPSEDKAAALLRVIMTVVFLGFGFGGLFAGLSVLALGLTEHTLVVALIASFSTGFIVAAFITVRIFVNRVRASNKRVAWRSSI